MATKVTKGVRISVKPKYQNEYSNPHNAYYVFSYEVTIENQNMFPVQLLRRHWIIKDSTSEIKEVKGDGVVGLQPTLAPGEKHSYQSACNLNSDMGSMQGFYTFLRLDTGELMKAKIPEFKMIVPFRLN